MGKQVRLTDLVVALLEREMHPRESYSDTLERLLVELHRFRGRVRILDYTIEAGHETRVE